MKKTWILLLALNYILGLELSAQTEVESINKTLQNYIEGTANGEPERLKSAFQSDFNLFVIILFGRESIQPDIQIFPWSGRHYVSHWFLLQVDQFLGDLSH